MFDIDIAVAKLDVEGCGGWNARPDFDNLRRKYPELAFIFDKLEDFYIDSDGLVDQEDLNDAKREIDRLSESLLECSERFAQIRDMAATLARFDAADSLLDEIEQLENKADDGYAWAEQTRQEG